MVPFQTIPPSESFGRKDFFDSLTDGKCNIFHPFSMPVRAPPSAPGNYGFAKNRLEIPLLVCYTKVTLTNAPDLWVLPRDREEQQRRMYYVLSRHL